MREAVKNVSVALYSKDIKSLKPDRIDACGVIWLGDTLVRQISFPRMTKNMEI